VYAATKRWRRRRALGRGKVKGRSPDRMSSGSMREAGAPSTEVVVLALWVGCARPTGGSHGRTPGAPEQRFNGVNLRATLEVG
jgi:hypothetical protein